jgi:hypothetical protein
VFGHAGLRVNGGVHEIHERLAIPNVRVRMIVVGGADFLA